MSNTQPMVGIVMGSKSDLPIMEETSKILEFFNIPYEVKVTSAHRSPKQTREYAESAQDRGLKIIIAGAGAAAHLAGVIAAETLIPVIGVPVNATSLGGLDALLSTVQMPGGIPVATVAIGKSGAKNAGVLAARIIGLSDPAVAEKLIQYKKQLEEGVGK